MKKFLPKAKLKGNNKFWINSWNLRSWHFTQYYCDNKHVKKMTTGRNFLLSFLNEWRCENSHFWDSHFHINWFILRHLFVMFFRLFTAHLSLSFCPIISVMNLRKEKGKLKKQKNEIKRKNFELTNWIIFYFLLFYACMNEEFFIIFWKEMLNFLSFCVKRLPLFLNH